MTLAPQHPPRNDEEGLPTIPRADCVADSAGGLTFDIADHGVPGPAHLVLRLRGGEEEVRLPLAPAAEGRLRAALPSGVDVPEGRWDAYVQPADGEPLRLAPGLNDLRSLVDRATAGSVGSVDRVAVRIPYGTKHNNLSVRSWERSPHAEAGELHIGNGALDVSVRVFGSAVTPDAYAELTDRRGTSPAVRAELAPDQGRFRFTVAYGALRAGVWDLWLRPEGAAGPRVRVARLLDDIAEKKPVFVYPTVRVDTEHGSVTAEPYYTVDNDLSVTVTAVS